jgi:trans-aconitate 2-methyltransferase
MDRAADWDATRYHRVAQPHAAWGANVLDRITLRGDEVVLDAGCGSGRVTAQLLERLPRGRVIAADRSPAMLAEARNTLGGVSDRVTFLEADLLEVDRVLPRGHVDVVFSTATFHWIADHQRLFNALHEILQPGGRLVAQFGGGHNLAGFMQATDAVAARPPFVARFAGCDLWRFYDWPEQTRAHLEAAGFSSVEAWLEPSPQTFSTHASLAEFCRAVVLSSHLAVLPEALRDPFLNRVVEEIAARQGGLVLDYIRLNADAVA